jgi:DNA repair exonuclease SbcCD ATPase subunit
MKTIYSIYTIALIFILLLCSCSPKQSAINQLENLAIELEENCEDYSQEDWDSFADEFYEIEEDLEQYDYTDEELKEIGRLKAKCIKAITISTSKLFKSKVHNFQKQFEGAIEELESTMDELNKIFEER